MDVLIVQEPHLNNILNRKTTWEIRRTDTKKRGLIGLGLNHKIYGTAVLENSFPKSIKELKKHSDKHQISEEWLIKYAKGKKTLYVWELKDIRKFKSPKPIPRAYGRWVKTIIF